MNEENKLLEIIKTRLVIFKDIKELEEKGVELGELNQNVLITTNERISELEQILFEYEVKC